MDTDAPIESGLIPRINQKTNRLTFASLLFCSIALLLTLPSWFRSGRAFVDLIVFRTVGVAFLIFAGNWLFVRVAARNPVLRYALSASSFICSGLLLLHVFLG